MSLIILPAQTLVAGGQTIAPSSNDWDYNFERAAGQYQMSGNALGDHEEGGNLRVVSGDGMVSSLITLDGDFEISWTWTTANGSFGVHEIEEDSKRNDDQTAGMKVSSTESFFYDEANSPGKHFWYGNAEQTGTGAYTFANGSVVKIERVGSAIKVYDDGDVAHAFSQTSSEPMRLFLGHGGTPFTEVIKDLFIVDSEKVQREGFYNEGTSSNQGFGTGGGYANGGVLWTATRTGTVESLIVNVDNVASGPMNVHVELWSHDGTNPDAQIGSDSAAQSLNSTGKKTFTFGTEPSVAKGTKYWCILVDRDGGSGDIQLALLASADGFTKWGRHSTIGSISAGGSEVQAEIVVNTTEEPLPDYDTLLLIHSEGADGNQDFNDSSQYASQADRQDTPSGDVHHDNQQAKFGSTSIQFDGTGDYVSYPDSADWQLGDVHTDFTVDFWIYLDGLGTDEFVVAHATGFSWSGINWYFNRDSAANKMTLYYGNSGGTGTSGITTTTALSATTWHHVAVTKSRGHFTIYLDGNAETTADIAYTGTSIATPLLLGIGVSATNPLNGRIEELRISKVARWDADFDEPTAPYPTD